MLRDYFNHLWHFRPYTFTMSLSGSKVLEQVDIVDVENTSMCLCKPWICLPGSIICNESGEEGLQFVSQLRQLQSRFKNWSARIHGRLAKSTITILTSDQSLSS